MLTFIRCPFHPSVTLVHVKEPGHSAKSAGGRLHVDTHTPLTYRNRSELTMLLSRYSVGTYQKTSSQGNSSGNTRPQSSQVADPLCTDPGLKSGIGVRKLTSTRNNNNKKRRRGMNHRTFPQHPRKQRKSHHPTNNTSTSLPPLRCRRPPVFFV